MSEQDPARPSPSPTHVPALQDLAGWLAEHTGGVAQSSLGEALLNQPTTVHLVDGAVIAADAERGVVDDHGRVFGCRRLLVADAAAIPANPGVNPALTVTALAERMLTAIPTKEPDDRMITPDQ
jgi:cholesterol oxidase